MQDYKTMISMCAEQEEKFQFEHFSREDALKIGLKLHENAKEQPVAVEITVNGLVVFRYFAEGAKPDSELWLARKRNAVDLMETSSLRFFAELEDAGETFADRKLDPNEYAAGGGFPIRIEEVGVIGAVIVSGLPHFADHDLIVKCISRYLHVDEVPRIRGSVNI